jgi:steroid delta-isomerase-like uncharacterized protein
VLDAIAKLHIPTKACRGSRHGVARRWRSKASTEGELPGIKPTAGSFRVGGISIYRLGDGKTAEHWKQADTLGRLPHVGSISSDVLSSAICPNSRPREYELMSTEANKDVVRRFAQVVFDEKRFDRADEVALSNYVDHGAMPGQPPGLQGAKQKWTMWSAACPDLLVSTEDLLAEGDRVALRWRAAGTHTGTLLGLPASGKRFQFDGMSVFRIAEGKVAEQWEAWDRFDLLQQLGAVSSPAAASA